MFVVLTVCLVLGHTGRFERSGSCVCTPSMSNVQMSESLIPSPVVAKGSEAQGRPRKGSSEGSAEQRHGSMNKNRLIRREGRTSGQTTAKSLATKAPKRKGGERVPKDDGLIWGGPRGAGERSPAGCSARGAEHRGEVSRGRSSDEGRETGWSEGPNGAPEWARARGGRVSRALP
jgi:hypothetical protein